MHGKAKSDFLLLPFLFKMKFHSLSIVMLVLSVAFFSCKKDDDNTVTPTPTPTPTNQQFISFTFDGVATNITGVSSIATGVAGGGAYTSGGFFDFSNDSHISLSMPQDTIVGSDLKSLIGQKIPIGSCLGCPTNIDFDCVLNGVGYATSVTNNPYPANYMQINAVTFKGNSLFGGNLGQYYVEGEFNVNLSGNSTVKSVSDGKFRLVFQEVKP